MSDPTALTAVEVHTTVTITTVKMGATRTEKTETTYESSDKKTIDAVLKHQENVVQGIYKQIDALFASIFKGT